MFFGVLRQVIADVDNGHVWHGEHLADPLITEPARDGFAVECADEDGEVIGVLACELDEELMAAVGREKFAED